MKNNNIPDDRPIDEQERLAFLKAHERLLATRPERDELDAALRRIAELAALDCPASASFQRLLPTVLDCEAGLRVISLGPVVRRDLVTVTAWLLSNGDAQPIQEALADLLPPRFQMPDDDEGATPCTFGSTE